MYERTPDHGLAPREPVSRIPAPHDCGGHGIFSTPADWTRFITMLLADGTPFLTPATRKHRRDLPPSNNRPLRAPSPSFRPAARIAAFHGGGGGGGDGDQDYVWGAGVYARDFGEAIFRTLQWAGRPNLYWWIDRAKGVAATTFTQVISAADARFAAITGALDGAVYAELV